MAAFVFLIAFNVVALDATYFVRVDEKPGEKIQRVTLVPNPFEPHTCSDKELRVLEGTFPAALAVDITERIRKNSVQLWFARDIMSYAAKYLKVI